jgi:hypothetical protein
MFVLSVINSKIGVTFGIVLPKSLFSKGLRRWARPAPYVDQRCAAISYVPTRDLLRYSHVNLGKLLHHACRERRWVAVALLC